MEYTFTLKYQLSDEDCSHEELVERLGVAGCTDALVGVGRPGRIGLEFVREAHSAEEAMRSALQDVQTAIPSARLIEASPDLVGITDAADVIGISRQGLRKLAMEDPTSFPTPVHEGMASVWHLADILVWLHQRRDHQVHAAVIDITAVARQVNVAKEAWHLTPGKTSGFEPSFRRELFEPA